MEEKILLLSKEYKESKSGETLSKISELISETPLKEINQILLSTSKPSLFLETILLGINS
jgi:hypothetical protein